MNLLQAVKKTFWFSLPMIGMRSISALSGFFAMIMIAHLGHLQLAAGALIASIQAIISVTGYSLLFSMSVVVGRLYGEKKYKEAGRTLRQGLLLSIIVAIPMSLLYWNMPSILIWLHQPKNLIILITPYFRVMAWGTFSWMILVSLTQFLTGISKPRISFQFNLISLITYIIPSYALLFGHFGLPALGIVGVAYANIFTGYFISLIIIVFLLYGKDFQAYKIFILSAERNWEYFKKLYKIGFPILLQTASELGAFAFITFMIGWLGEISLAAQQIIFQLGSIVVMIQLGISQSSAILVGQALGREDYQATRTFGLAGVFLGLIFSLAIAFIYLAFPEVLIRLFDIGGQGQVSLQIFRITVILLGIEAADTILDFIRNISIGALRGFHDTKTPMLNSLFIYWIVAIPLGYIFGFTLHWDIIGIRAAFVIAVAIGAIMMFLRLHKKTLSLAPQKT